MASDLTVRELAKLASVHPGSIRRLARAGRLPGAYKSVYGNSGFGVVRLEAWHENPILQT